MRVTILTILVTAIFLASVGCTSNAITYESSFSGTALPVDDELLQKWYSKQPSVLSAKITREENTVRIVYTSSHRGKHLVPPWPELGYKGVKTLVWTSSGPGAWARLVAWFPIMPFSFWLLVGVVTMLVTTVYFVGFFRGKQESQES